MNGSEPRGSVKAVHFLNGRPLSASHGRSHGVIIMIPFIFITEESYAESFGKRF
jgi:hypothetical protein